MKSTVPPTTTTTTTTTLYKRKKDINLTSVNDSVDMVSNKNFANGNVNGGGGYTAFNRFDPSFMKWTTHDVVNVVKFHWLPCVFGLGLLFFMAVEYTLRMVPASSPPFDLGFLVTRHLHLLLSSWPALNTLLAFLNTGFLGSGVDFPVGNVSFFLFFSGHVAGSVIASLDMRRMQRWELAWTYDVLNVLQAVRLLGTRGHYTIDLATGVGAGILFDSLAGKYEESKRKQAVVAKESSLFS
ncbi:phosphatidylcholine:diacylglycerol cholinephosphotransferase 1 isoform X2 [Ricinus communis]|uniref:phosphatidylcholine:diacylglycerol cholinephosphotransferase 1 isoform X2 n=1 Tax=Ricinus communis TaxID=3988 RepID=UPI00201A6780|nr:phosphatidylcholine:diacylglycerol cholinephosphotransferase 1 isoform X2 [Ricinus communis]